MKNVNFYVSQKPVESWVDLTFKTNAFEASDAENASKKLKAARVVIATNVLLIAAKAAVAFLTGSIAVIAILLDSIFDLLGSLFAYLGVKEAAKPPDADHLYGHAKLENLSSLAQIALIAIVAFGIILEAARRFALQQKIAVNSLDLTIIFVTIIIDVGLALYLRRKSRELHSVALEASAGNYFSDIFQNAVALAGLFFVGFGLFWADPLAAVVLALLMLRVVYRVGWRSANELIDVSPPKETLEAIKSVIRGEKYVKSFHKLRARQQENKIFLDVDIQLNPKLPLERAHYLAHKLKRKLASEARGASQIADAVIHIEPFEKTGKNKKIEKKKTVESRKINGNIKRRKRAV
ncbi:MAG: cation diffusion facilitator family transporter [Candidatus Micrarchaeota archaeon]